MQIPSGFDKALAVECASLVDQAYQQYAHFLQGASWSLQGAYDTIAVLNARPEGLLARLEPFGFVARDQASKAVFVVFRGTQSPEDWMSDLTFPQVAHPWGRVEAGFWFLYAQCSADVRNAVKSAGGSGKPIVTGHSLGAALALLAAADLADTGAAMYSFAGPRVGDPAFANAFNRQVGQAWRVTNTEDVVTTVPLATPILLPGEHVNTALSLVLMMARGLNYAHAGTPVCFTAHNGSIMANHALQVYSDALKAG
jgi:triacylglycerol lipase